MTESDRRSRPHLTEQGWLADGTDVYDLLEYLRGKASDRKLRLFAIACCRRPCYQSVTDERYRRALRLAERMADEPVDEQERKETYDTAYQLWEETWAVTLAAQESLPRGTPEVEKLVDDEMVTAAGPVILEDAWDAAYQVTAVEWDRNHADEPRHQAALLRDIFGNPFRAPPAIDPAWRSPFVMELARRAYDERHMPAGTLDPRRLAELADTLERAGCHDPVVLGHLRWAESHVRGCHVLDLLFSKE